MIKRSAETALNDWIINGKDALLLTGARQIGKTYLIRQFLANSGIPYVEFNFIEQPELISLFFLCIFSEYHFAAKALRRRSPSMSPICSGNKSRRKHAACFALAVP